VELGRGTLKQLLFLLVLLGNAFYLSAQDAPAPKDAPATQGSTAAQKDDFPVINESDLPLFTDGQTAAPAEADVPASVGFSDLLRVIVILAAVIGAIYLLLYFLKKITPMDEQGEEKIKLLATRHLKKDTSLHIIEVGNQIFLIGSGSSTVNLISEITDKETRDQIHLEKESLHTLAGDSFRSLFRKGLSLGKGKKVSDQSPEFLRNQRDRLKKLGDQE